MENFLYIISGIFALLGVGVWLAAAKSKSVSHILGGLCYVGGAIGSVMLHSWWPLIIGFGLAFIVRKTFGDPHRASSVTSRSNEYKQLSLIIGDAFATVNFNSEIIEKRQEAEDRLFSLIEQDPELIKTFEPQGADINKLKKIYYTLIHAGVGHAGSEWIPSVAIVTPYTLSYLLKELANENLNTNNPSDKIIEIAFNVFYYFKRGDPLP